MFFKKVRATRGPYYETERGPSSSRSRRARGDRLETRLATAEAFKLTSPVPGRRIRGTPSNERYCFLI